MTTQSQIARPSSFPLTEKQMAVLEPGTRLIEAGPGAGKTRAIVARFKEQAHRSSRGIALLSFTNAAVNEAKLRCADSPHLVEAPHFLGTFDHFFHRYIVTPYIVSNHGVMPTYLASWDDLPDHLARIRTQSGGIGIRLSRFRRRANKQLYIESSYLSHAEKQYWERLTPQAQAWIQGEASRVHIRLLDRHIYDTSSARQIAFDVLQQGSTSKYMLRLSRRFTEVIVDEFQDCDESEHRLLELLTASGVSIVVVADPDQAIYEFRQVSNNAYARYREKIPQEEIVELDVCHRSTQAICGMVTSLRSVGRSPVVPSAETTNYPTKTFVIVGSGNKLKEAAQQLNTQYGVKNDSFRVLSHATSDARKISIGGIEPPNGSSITESFLTSLVTLRNSGNPKMRLAAVRRLERSILDLFQWPDATSHGNRVLELESLGLGPTQLRILVGRLQESSKAWKSPDDCGKGLRNFIKIELGNQRHSLIPTLSNKLSKPTSKLWTYWEESTTSNPNSGVPALWANIHAVKGAEFDSVLLALPQRTVAGRSHVLDDWSANINSEQRRVLYVGASRAKRLLMLGTPKTRLRQLIQILERDQVSYEVIHAK
ncbi:UvrD-helicase domain-containing protein [Paeniglutamicibacter kerguelensis]|uniref:DNA 3'-5' helicase n=1 Tax=Paeniglutamicibacter kerguelensis TaxID=254788 RepID=A0ABS4XIZ3_9MICC|nr:ATP-dependent helicase [Paeniglutamicibacter kerguelensis]MBP2388429.1 superfamily I DNA/RNA helicase [Paeniglutamicibacter kerguelensis]